jgi:hypothetical protein
MHRFAHVRDDLMPSIEIDFRQLARQKLDDHTLGNRIHVAPALNLSDTDAATGLAVLDEALAAADTFLD